MLLRKLVILFVALLGVITDGKASTMIAPSNDYQKPPSYILISLAPDQNRSIYICTDVPLQKPSVSDKTYTDLIFSIVKGVNDVEGEVMNNFVEARAKLSIQQNCSVGDVLCIILGEILFVPKEFWTIYGVAEGIPFFTDKRGGAICCIGSYDGAEIPEKLNMHDLSAFLQAHNFHAMTESILGYVPEPYLKKYSETAKKILDDRSKNRTKPFSPFQYPPRTESPKMLMPPIPGAAETHTSATQMDKEKEYTIAKAISDLWTAFSAHESNILTKNEKLTAADEAFARNIKEGCETTVLNIASLKTELANMEVAYSKGGRLNGFIETVAERFKELTSCCPGTDVIVLTPGVATTFERIRSEEKLKTLLTLEASQQMNDSRLPVPYTAMQTMRLYWGARLYLDIYGISYVILDKSL